MTGDVTMEVSVKKTSGRGIELSARYDEASRRQVGVEISGMGSNSGGEYSSYKLILKESESKLQVYLNDNLISEDNIFTRGKIPSGPPALILRDSHVFFDNIKITGKLDEDWIKQNPK